MSLAIVEYDLLRVLLRNLNTTPIDYEWISENKEIQEFVESKDCCCCMKSQRYCDSIFHGYYDDPIGTCEYHKLKLSVIRLFGKTFHFDQQSLGEYNLYEKQTAISILEYYKKVLIEKSCERTKRLKEELIAKAYHPKRVERWLEEGGWELVETMFG